MRLSPWRTVLVMWGTLICLQGKTGCEFLWATQALLSVQKNKLLLRSGTWFLFTLKTKGAPPIPFTMSYCDFTWNCCYRLPRKQDEIKLRGIYLSAFWADMCGCLFSCFCSEPRRITWKREWECVNKRPLSAACSIQESCPPGWQFPKGWADKGDLFWM